MPATRLVHLLERLEGFYGRLKAPPEEPFRLFVWDVLSVHAAPARRDAAMAALQRIPALTPDAMWRAPRGKLEAAVQQAGPYLEQRLQALQIGVQVFRRAPDLPRVLTGPLAAARRALKPLPRLGDTGPHRMLLFSGGHLVLPVDAPACRTGLRLGYGRPAADFRGTVKRVQHALVTELPPEVAIWRRAAIYLSHHGAATCVEAAPHCSVCPLLVDCADGQRRSGLVRRPGPARVN
ncbi:MAG: hypothetical protein KGN76_17350 [Acidobacteriota bacterium]|nr:hypothetical protein [Acidobacteriota bacterium]